MMLQINEIFYSLQGEGTYSGTPAVFIRLAGCNLSCDFCDTDYSLKTFSSIEHVVVEVGRLAGDCPMVILTGGEPLAQSETLALITALQNDNRRVHIESNGTIATELPSQVWLTVSPKERLNDAMAARANEAKLIVDKRVPLEWIERFGEKTAVFLQPEGNKPENIKLAIEAVKTDPRRLRLSLQTHKMIGIR